MNAVLRWALLIIFTSCFLLACGGGAGTDVGTVEQNNVANFTGDLNNELGVEGSGVGPTDGDIVGSSDGPVDEGIEGSGTGPIEGQVELGPVIKALVEVFDTEDLTKPIFTTTTTESTDLKLAGTFTIPDGIINKSKLYLVKGSEGFDIDIDDDGILNQNDTDVDGNGIEDLDEDEDKDGIVNREDTLDYSGGIKGPLPVQGVTRLLITGEQMVTLKWNASAITEYVFGALQFSELDTNAISETLETMDQMAPILLGKDLNGDDLINATDLIIWDPNSSSYQNTFFSSAQLREFIKLVHDGKNLAKSSIPTYKRLISHVDTKSSAERVIVEGNIAYVATPGMVLFFDVSDAENPEIVGRYFTGPIRDFVIGNGKLFYTNESGLNVIDVSDPAQPVFLKFFAFDAIQLKLSNDQVILLTAEMNEYNFLNHYVTTISTSSLEKIASQYLPNNDYTEMSVANNLVYVWKDGGSESTDHSFGGLVVFDIGNQQIISLSNSVSIPTSSLIDQANKNFKDESRYYWYNNVLTYDNIVPTMTKYANNEELLDEGIRQVFLFKARIETDKEPYNGYNLFTAHGNHLFVLSDQHTYSAYDMTDPDSPERLAASLDICVEHTALRFTDKFIMTKCRDEFRFWDVNTLEFLGVKSVAAFNIRPGIFLDPANGLNLLEKMYHVALHYFIDKRISTNANEVVGPKVLDFLRNLNLVDLFKSFFNWQKWGIMMTHDFDISGNTVFLATGSHGLQILNFNDIELSTTVSGNISLGELDPQKRKIPLSNNGFIGDAKVDIVPLSNLKTSDTCSGVSSTQSNADAGKVLIPKECIKGEKYYLVTATGGQNLDPDNDGSFEESPIEVEGTIHGIFTEKELNLGGWQVNLYTEYLYQKVKSRLESGLDEDQVFQEYTHEQTAERSKLEQLSTLILPITADDNAGLLAAVEKIANDRTHYYNYGFTIKKIIATDSRLYLLGKGNSLYISDTQTHQVLNSIQLPQSTVEIYLFNGFLYAISGSNSLSIENSPIGQAQITQLNVANDNLSIASQLLLDEKVQQLVDSKELGILALTTAHYIQVQPPGFTYLELSNNYKAKTGALESGQLAAADANLIVTVTEQFKPDISLYPEGDTYSLIDRLASDYSGPYSTEQRSDLLRIEAWHENGTPWQEVDKSPFVKYGDDISDPSITFSVNDLLIASMNYYFAGYISPNDFIFDSLTDYYFLNASENNIRIQTTEDLSLNLMKSATITTNPGEKVISISVSDNELTLHGVSLKNNTNYIEVYDLQDPYNPQLQARYEKCVFKDENGDLEKKLFYPKLITGGKAYTTAIGKLFAFELGNEEIARELWNIDLEGLSISSIAIVGEKAYIATDKEGLVEINLGE